MRIAFLTAPEGVEQVELTEPWKAAEQAGHEPVLVSTQSGEVQAFHHLDKADTFPVQEVVGDTSADSFDGLVLPGGVANPDFLRMDDKAVGFVRDFFEQGRPVAAICHAPWTLIEADVVRGRVLTCIAVRGRNGRVIIYDRVIASCRLNGRRVGDLLRAAGGREGGN